MTRECIGQHLLRKVITQRTNSHFMKTNIEIENAGFSRKLRSSEKHKGNANKWHDRDSMQSSLRWKPLKSDNVIHFLYAPTTSGRIIQNSFHMSLHFPSHLIPYIKPIQSRPT